MTYTYEHHTGPKTISISGSKGVYMSERALAYISLPKTPFRLPEGFKTLSTYLID